TDFAPAPSVQDPTTESQSRTSARCHGPMPAASASAALGGCRLRFAIFFNEAHPSPVCSGGFMNTQSLNGRIRRRVCLAVGVSVLFGAGLAAAADTTPPTITAAVTPAPNANGWNRTNVTVRFTCADTESGIGLSRGDRGAHRGQSAGDLGHGARQGRQQR